MQQIILKFGGSSLADTQRISRALDIIEDIIDQGKQPLTVVSALGGVTNTLISLCDMAISSDKSYIASLQDLISRHKKIIYSLVKADQQSNTIFRIQEIFRELRDNLNGLFLLRELTPRAHDLIMSCGERVAAILIAAALQSRDIRTKYCDARKIIVTNNRFGSAKVQFPETNTRIQSHFIKSIEPWIITGFIAANTTGETTTLGRSGSDYTASIIGAALNVEKIVIWTDVDGVMTADPRKTTDAFAIPQISYEDAMELSHFGAKVIFPPTMIPAMKMNIPIHIRNSFFPEKPGTVISSQGTLADYHATGIASIEHVALLRMQGSGMVGVRGISARLFDCLAQREINIILITQASSEHSICFAVDAQKTDLAIQILEETFQLEMETGMIDAIVPERDTAIIAVVGDKMRHKPGIAAEIFRALGRQQINVKAISQGSSERNISIVIAREDEHAAINVLHRALFPIKEKTVIYLIGTGLVGQEFIKLLMDGKLQLNGVINSRKMLLHSDGVKVNKLVSHLQKKGKKADISHFLQMMKVDPTPRKICVDCTASQDITNCYHDILAMGVSIVTPNKIANTRSMDYYTSLREISRKNQVLFKYETTVGAALPVISTLRTMLETGDRIHRIEAVLSGTLSYIFNTLSSDISFSNIVKRAVEKGFSEPDPREDLQGIDVARKALILAREIGYELEMPDAVPSSLISDACKMAASSEEIIALIAADDAAWRKRITALQKNGKVLRYIAEIKEGKITISVKEIDANHPFYHLSGPDNIVAIYSDRYPINPLVIKGAGAGAVVTAGGIMGDVIGIAGT